MSYSTTHKKEVTMKCYCVYIMASKRNGTLYIGITSELPSRVWQHKNSVVKSFTSKYKIHNLVYYEVYGDAYTAIQREKRLKKWNRAWKIKLIEEKNPNWDDLYKNISGY